MSFAIRNILLIGIVLLILAWTIWPAMLVPWPLPSLRPMAARLTRVRYTPAS